MRGDEAATTPAAGTLSAQFRMMWSALWTSPTRSFILWLYAGILAVILATAFGQVLLNRWNQPFFDALERRDLGGFLDQLMVFGVIAGTLLVLNVGQSWLNQSLHIRLREGLTRDLMAQWLQPRRAFRLGQSGEIGINPDQRMHEDARHLADLTADLSTGLMQATILLASFVGVLWAISSDFAFTVAGRTIDIPGYMVWAAFLYAALASGLSWLAGRPLIRLNEVRYAREAEFRVSLMRASERADAISLAGGEGTERRRLENDLSAVLGAVRSIMTAAVRLTWVTAGYGWITVVAPIVIAAPVYFSGELTFGGLMMAAAAFTQVNGALRWFVDNIGGIADWRATLLRVAAFRATLLAMDAEVPSDRAIARREGPDGRLVLDAVEVEAADGSMAGLEPATVELRPGGRLRISGAPGAGKTLLFRAIAGLLSPGSGSILLPPGADIAFVPSQPFVPDGTLLDALAYPQPASTLDPAPARSALDGVGLAHLSGRLDEAVRWSRELSDDEHRLIAFARLLVRQPGWIVVDEALDALDSDARTRVLDTLQRELPGTAMLTIGTDGLDDPRLGPVATLRKAREDRAAGA